MQCEWTWWPPRRLASIHGAGWRLRGLPTPQPPGVGGWLVACWAAGALPPLGGSGPRRRNRCPARPAVATSTHPTQNRGAAPEIRHPIWRKPPDQRSFGTVAALGQRLVGLVPGTGEVRQAYPADAGLADQFGVLG